MDEKDLAKLVTSVGAMAEISALFYNTLLRNDISRPDALVLTEIFMKNLLAKK